jgi:phosphoserine phosphatase RsbU/P
MMMISAGDGRCEVLHGSNLPLGIREGEIFEQVEVPFAPGDLFVLYSDGITEMRSPAGELFGSQRLGDFLQANRTLEPAALVAAVRDAAVAFAGTDRPADDLTCVAVRVLEPQWPLTRAQTEISSDLAELRRARDFVRAFCGSQAACPLADADVAALELAVNEAASNVMKHAYRGRADQRIQLDAERFPDRIVVRLHHVGDPFDPAAVTPPVFDGSRESGFGLYLITHSVDEVSHSRDERGRNCIALVKTLNP